METMVVKR